jgi:hypothetical protein
MLTLFTVRAQDKVFLLDGTLKQGKILEIATEAITLENDSETQNIYRYEIAVIEFKNGTIEIINEPAENLVYNTRSAKVTSDTKQLSLYKPHFVSVNTLALYNADVSNAKKNYDLGGLLNLYPTAFSSRTTFYLGIMVKYTSFNFNKTRTDSVSTGSNQSAIVTFIPAKGSQLATIFTLGTHTTFNENFYIKTIAGLGAFRLRGDYKEELNKIFNDDPKSSPVEFNYLPKIYIGINIGFNL